jgi:hypothetical protein
MNECFRLFFYAPNANEVLEYAKFGCCMVKQFKFRGVASQKINKLYQFHEVSDVLGLFQTSHYVPNALKTTDNELKWL